MITTKILKDSITDDGSRLTTWEWTYPRFIHAEIMTHRALSKNAASSRAIPTKALRQRVIDTPAIPVHWGARQAGMQAEREIDDIEQAKAWWTRSIDTLVRLHWEGEALGLHKQIVNRIIEPGMLITIIISGTDWANFFHLRNHPDAEPNFQRLASLAWNEYHNHMPTYVSPGGWHTPLVDKEEAIQLSEDDLKKVSVGRCARVSYLTHDGKRDFAKDIELHDKLLGTIDSGGPGHLSPFEHVAQAVGNRNRHGNFEGWKQYRKCFNNENGPETVKCEKCGCWNNNHVTICPARLNVNA
jgi:thymidylate synthase ThyX